MPKAAQNVFEADTWQARAFPLALVLGWGGVTAILSLLFFQSLDESRLRVRATHDVLIALKEFLSAAIDAETGQRGYLITQKDSYLPPYRDGLATAQSNLTKLESLQSGDPQQLARLSGLRRLWIEKAGELSSTIEEAQKTGFQAARAAVGEDRGIHIMDKIRLAVSEIEAAEETTRAGAIAAQSAQVRRLFAFTQLTALASFAALLFLLSQARRTAEQLRLEVASRHTADELARERAEQALRMRVMNRELVHRTKNLISVVQAIVRNQEKSSPEIDRYVTGLSNRLVSLGSTLDILVRENWSQVKLEDLIAGQLGHFSEDITRRIAVAPGPPIKFTASEGQMLGLALHELGTNAAKYGALSVTGGRVDINWREELAGDGVTIILLWREENGPPVEAPTRRGFGSRITESLVARAVGGVATIEYLPSGLTWSLTYRRDRHDPENDDATDTNPSLPA